jgi:hypothetical protein
MRRQDQDLSLGGGEPDRLHCRDIARPVIEESENEDPRAQLETECHRLAECPSRPEHPKVGLRAEQGHDAFAVDMPLDRRDDPNCSGRLILPGSRRGAA